MPCLDVLRLGIFNRQITESKKKLRATSERLVINDKSQDIEPSIGGSLSAEISLQTDPRPISWRGTKIATYNDALGDIMFEDIDYKKKFFQGNFSARSTFILAWKECILVSTMTRIIRKSRFGQRVRIVAITLCISLFFSSCGLFSNKNMARRYRNIYNKNLFRNAPDPTSFVQVDLNSVLIKELPSIAVNYNVLTLTEKGQEAFISAANLKSSDSKSFIELLTSNFSFSKEAKPNIRIIPKTLKKTIVFTIERLLYEYKKDSKKTVFNLSGDRVAYLELDVRIPNNKKAIFDSWDRYVTDHLTLNLGKVTSAQQWNASLNLNAKGTGEMSLSGTNTLEDFDSNKATETATLINSGATNSNNYELLRTEKGIGSKSNNLKIGSELGGSGSLGYLDKYETTLDLNSRILKLSGSLAEKKLILRQEGGPSIDLSGNVVVSVEYSITDDWATPVQFMKVKEFYGNGLPIALDKLKISNLTVVFPDIKEDIVGQLDYRFLYRQVKRGNRHLPEARQRVTYWYGNVPFSNNSIIDTKPVVLVKTGDIRPKAYSIKSNGNILNIQGQVLKFETINEATSFIRYVGDLINNSKSLSLLQVSGAKLTGNDYYSLKIITEQL